MPTSASTKATTASGERLYPLNKWLEASEGFPMIDVYRWWLPKLGSMDGNFDILTLWHTLEIPSVNILNAWRGSSLHSQAVDLLAAWRVKEQSFDVLDFLRTQSFLVQTVDLLDAWKVKEQCFDVYAFLRKESLRARSADILRAWDVLRDPPGGITYYLANPLLEWFDGATQATSWPIDEWLAVRKPPEVGQWKWANEQAPAQN